MTPAENSRTPALRDYLQGIGESDCGLQRKENQDSLLVLETPSFHLYGVADGMGGSQGGSVASRLAISALEETARTAKWNQFTLPSAFLEAHRHIREEISRNPDLEKMGTTLVSLAIFEDRIFLANVGDSRAYHYHAGRLTKLTEDHTLVADLLKNGAITPQQARSNPMSHVLTQSVGSKDPVHVDFWASLSGAGCGDRFILCSDGLHSQVTDEEISQICSSGSALEVTQALIKRANEKGGRDNVTVIVVDVGETCSRMASAKGIVFKKLNPETSRIDDASLTKMPKLTAAAKPVMRAIPEPRPLVAQINPILAAAFLFSMFLLGLYVGSQEASWSLRKIAPPRYVDRARSESSTERGAENTPLRKGGIDSHQAFLARGSEDLADRAAKIARINPGIESALAKYNSARSAYLDAAQTLLTNPPNEKREQEVLRLLSSYEQARRELDEVVRSSSPRSNKDQ